MRTPYSQRSPEAKRRKQALNQARRARTKALLDAYKETRGCADCGEKDPIVLDFDHRDPATKKFNIGSERKSKLFTQLLDEMEKCDIVCANCHRRRTHARCPIRA